MQQDIKTKILIVDDRPDKLLVCQAILEDLGQIIFTANSGEEALKLVLEHEFAVILLDVNMPGLDGLETAALIRGRKKSAHTPIIFITAFGDDMHASKGYSLGAVDYILSPVNPAILRTKVRVFVELSRMAERTKEHAEERILLVKEQTARAAAEEASRRSLFLAEAGASLASSLDLRGRTATLASLVIPSIADFCAILLIDERGACEEAELAWLDAGTELRRSNVSLSALAGSLLKKAINQTLESSKRVVMSASSDAEEGGSTNHLDDVNRFVSSLRSVAAFPLFARARMSGVLCIGIRNPRGPFSIGDLAVASDLADRAASALDNAVLYGKLQESDRRKDEFLAMLAHELRNPLAPIWNATKVLQLAGPNSDKGQWATSMINRQVEHMVRLVDDLLDVSRITQGKIDLRMAPVEIAGVVTRAIETSRPLLDSRRHRLEVMLPKEPLRISADPARIEQVLSNLLNNAAKFTDEGGQISVSVERDDTNLICKVRDSGVGIPGDALASIFDLFTQVGRARSIKGSLGIGLTLVRRLVEAHGGTVYAQSKGIGSGSEFVVRLPLLLEPTFDDVVPKAPTTHENGRKQLRVMVVDDDLDVSESTAELLRFEGCEVRNFNDGATALEELNRFKPDALLLDIAMPLMDGYELAKRIRAMPSGDQLVLIAASGYGRREDLEKSKKAGFDAHLVKPLDTDVLMSKLATLCPARDLSLG